MLPGTSTGWPMRAVIFGHVGVAGTEGAGGALAVDAHLLLLAADRMRFDLGHVVGHVVQQAQIAVSRPCP